MSRPAGAASGQDTDDLGREELVAALDELLEAERAGARLAVQLVRLATDPDARAVTLALLRDEARWCGMLVEALTRIEAKPSAKVGDFYAKAMAIDGLEARLAFVNRGQAWVVRKIEKLLPRIGDERLHADLKAMLEAHAVNIELTERALERRAAGRTT